MSDLVKDPNAAALINSLLCDRCGHTRVGLSPSCTCLRYQRALQRRREERQQSAVVLPAA